MNALLVRRGYLFAVWLWLVVCLLLPIWTSMSYRYDERTEQWYSNGSFEISGGGNLLTSAAPIWRPPGPLNGLASKVRWPLAPIEAANNVEIHVAATYWRFTVGLFFAGLAVMVARWTIPDGRSDRVLLVAGMVTIAILMANIVLFVLAALSMGLALSEPVVIPGVLSCGIVAGLIVGGLVLRTDTVKPSLPRPGIDKNATLSAPSGDSGFRTADKPSTFSAMRRLNWWWRPPAYLVLQLFVWLLIARQSWPIGRDVFGPYKCEADTVVRAYWAQFVVLPFLARRFRFFALGQLAMLVAIHILPDWPQGGNVFGPVILVPSAVWPLYWIQFCVTLFLVWCGPKLMRRISQMRKCETAGESK